MRGPEGSDNTLALHQMLHLCLEPCRWTPSCHSNVHAARRQLPCSWRTPIWVSIPYERSTLAAVQNLTGTIASVQLPQADTDGAFYQAILQSLQQPAGVASPNVTATLVAAAVGAGAGSEVGTAFQQVLPEHAHLLTCSLCHAHVDLLTLSWSYVRSLCGRILV